MRKARVKRYQTGGTVDDDEPNLLANNTSTPPLRRVNPSGTSTPAIAAARPKPIGTPSAATKPITPIATRNPFTAPPTPTGSVGSNQAVVKNPVIDPMANARALDAGAVRDASTGFGTGATSVANTKQYMAANAAPSAPGTQGFNLPSGGFAAVAAKKPLPATQPAGQATLAGLPRKPPGFIYGGRVDMTPPGKVGFKRPGPFRSGGRVPRFRFGGRVKKMQDGGEVAGTMREGVTTTRPLSASELASPTKTLDTRPNQTTTWGPEKPLHSVPITASEFNRYRRGGRVRKMQDGGSIFSPEHEDQGDSMSDQKTAGQVRMSPADLAARQAARNQSNETARARAMNERPVMRHGGKVKKMQDGGRAELNDQLNSSPETSFLGRPKPTPTPTPGPRFIDKVKGVAKAVADSQPDRFQDGGMVSGVARNTPAETQVQQTIHAPARHQFKMGGRIYQVGGRIPGQPPPEEAPDNVPAMLKPGEVVLNPKQQKRVVVKPGWQKGLNPKEKSAMSSMRLPRARNQRAVTGNTVPRIFGGK